MDPPLHLPDIFKPDHPVCTCVIPVSQTILRTYQKGGFKTRPNTLKPMISANSYAGRSDGVSPHAYLLKTPSVFVMGNTSNWPEAMASLYT